MIRVFIYLHVCYVFINLHVRGTPASISEINCALITPPSPRPPCPLS